MMLSRIAIRTRSQIARTACRAAAASAQRGAPVVARFQSTASVEEQAPAKTQAATVAPPQPEAATEKPFAPTPNRKYEFFQNVEITDSGVAIVRFDCPGKSVNTISFKVAAEAERLWQSEIQSNNDVKAVVFGSAKPNMFIAGADIFDIKAVENKQDLVPLIERGLHMFESFRDKGVPLVAAIDGPAIGGGLEWALWCDYRICTDNDKTKLGLAEVKLGLLPGFGGTQKLPETVGLQKAMDMMLTGKDIRPKQAKKMGLVDLVVAPASLESVAIASAEQLADGTLKPKKKKKSLMERFLEDTSVGQSLVWNQINKMVAKNTKGNYPAPHAIIQCVQHGLKDPSTRFKNEREQFAKLAATPESEALIGLFEGTQKLKKVADGLPKVETATSTVAVLGAGLMGAGIAQVSSERAGYNVLLKDRDMESIGRGLTYMQDNWNKKVKRRHMTDFQYSRNTSRITPLTDECPAYVRHMAKTDVIIEAVFEDLSLKQKIVAEMEAVTPDHTVFATNTSALPICDIAQGAKRPENIIGMHYFSPVPSMPLLEIIPHEGTSEQTIARALEVGAKQGKTCILVKDVPGFYVNRCLGPFLVEVSALVKDGVPLEQLDKDMKAFGMPVGPVTLADEVGVDVTSKMARFLSDSDMGMRMSGGDISLMEKMVEKGWLGKKSGQGFYTYGKGKKSKKTISPEMQAYVKEFATQNLKLDDEHIQDRIITRFVNETVKCLEDGVIADPAAGDIGLVFGTGFAPFRGGPFRYIDQMGARTFVDRMNRLTDQYGPQFEPCQLLQDHATADKKFHS